MTTPPGVPAFTTRDPALPEFWSERFDKHFMPWDRAGVPEQLKQFVAAAPAPMSTLVPGCGAGHEVGFLAASGWPVHGIDFSAAAVAAAQAVLGTLGEHVLQADFFTHVPSQPLQLIYERAFLCALPPMTWPKVIGRYGLLLPPGALLAGFFFFDSTAKGPPFGATPEQLDALLSQQFERIDDQPVTDSVAAFAGRERWQVWRRLPNKFSTREITVA
jgi:hypothetical protein